MPWNYAIDTERKLVISTGTGMIRSADLLEHQNRIVADKKFRRDFHQLVDLSEISAPEVDVAAVRAAAISNIYSAKSRRAFVVTDPVAVTLTKAFQSYRKEAGGKEQIRIFTNREEAMAWVLPDAHGEGRSRKP